MKIAALAHAFSGLSLLTVAAAGVISGHIGMLLYAVVSLLFFIPAWELKKSVAPAPFYFIAYSLFIVGASAYMLFEMVPALSESIRLDVGVGTFAWIVAVSAALGLSQTVALVAMLRTRMTNRESAE